eukprot:7898081-Alexandrium_andersonii.AAC.1
MEVDIAGNVRIDGRQVTKALLDHKMRRATSGILASVFVVVDPARPDAQRLWAAGLGGACVCSAEFFQSGGTVGACVQYKQATLKV